MALSAGHLVALVCSCVLVTLAVAAEDNKWVWGGARLIKDNTRSERLRDRELVEEFPVRRPLFRPAQDYQPGDKTNFRPPTRVSEVDSLNRFGPQTFAKPPRRIAENDRRPSTRGPGDSGLRDYNERPFGSGGGNGPDRFGGPNRPGNFGPEGPGNFGGPGGPGLGGVGQGGVGPGQGGPAILTGPVPSWEQGRLDGPFQGFDRCKCAHSLNCISPGIQFGHCGEGKMYCCHNSIHEGGGNANVNRDALGVSGPGIGSGIGPGIGGIGPGNGRPGPGNFDRPFSNGERPFPNGERPFPKGERPFPNGERPILGGSGLGVDRPILVGPGGPTGIVSEGLGGRPFSLGGTGGIRPGGSGFGGIGGGGNRPFLPDGSGVGPGDRPFPGQGGNRPGLFSGSNGFSGGSNNFNGGSNGFNGGSGGFNGGGNGFNGGPGGLNGGSNGFNGGSNGLNGGPNGFNGGPNSFNGGSNGFNGGSNGFNGGSNGFNGGPNRVNGGRPTGFNGGRPNGFGGGGNRPFVDYDDEFVGRNTNGKYSVSRYEPFPLASRSQRDAVETDADKEAVVVDAAKSETSEKV